MGSLGVERQVHLISISFFFKLFLSGQHLKAKMHAAGGAEAEPQKKRSRNFKMEGELDGKFAVLF